MWPTHKLHGVFDMPPGFGQVHLALYFKVDGVLRSFRNCFGAVGFQQLPRVAMDFDFSHGVILLLFRATVSSGRPRTVDVDTCHAEPVCILVRSTFKSLFLLLAAKIRQ